MQTLFHKLLLEVEGNLFQTSNLCHAYTHCCEWNNTSSHNILEGKVKQLELNIVMLEGKQFNIVMDHVNDMFAMALLSTYKCWTMLHTPIVSREMTQSLILVWKEAIPDTYNVFMHLLGYDEKKNLKKKLPFDFILWACILLISCHNVQVQEQEQWCVLGSSFLCHRVLPW